MDKCRITVSEVRRRGGRLLDELAQSGEPVTITKNGRPIARLVPHPDRLLDKVAPLPAGERPSPFGLHKGRIRITGDIVAPIYPDWEKDEPES